MTHLAYSEKDIKLRVPYVDSIQSISSPTLTQAYSNIPFPRDENFVGREDTLAQIDDEHANAKTRRWASLYGLGGIG